jgi:hypothetical protein
MPAAEQPKLQVIDTRSALFKQRIAEARRRLGADFSVCDVPVEVK